MRISTKSLQLQWLADIYRRQAEIARVQKQVTSGLRINTASDDPAGAGQLISLRQGLDRLENFAANGEAVRRRLALEESALDKFGNAIGRVRELAVQAGGGAQSNETRAAIATEMRELMANIVDVANSQDGEGRYLFAGNDVRTLPVTMANNNAIYNGDDGVRTQRIGDSRTIRESDPGSEVFFGIRNGNGTFFVQAGAANQGTASFRNATVTDQTAWVPDNYTITFTTPASYEVTDSGGAVVSTGAWSSGNTIAFNGIALSIDGDPLAGDTFSVRPSANRSVFGMMNTLISALETESVTPKGRASFQNVLNASLLNLDQVERHVEGIRATVGARLAAVEEQKNSNDDLALQLQTTMSSVRDVDYPKAISDLETNLTALEAAQKVFAQTRSLSLFDVL